MAVALLATFYGAAVANLFCLPIADKLHLKLVDEQIISAIPSNRLQLAA
jgi:chemotaxis protein MotA